MSEIVIFTSMTNNDDTSNLSSTGRDSQICFNVYHKPPNYISDDG